MHVLGKMSGVALAGAMSLAAMAAPAAAESTTVYTGVEAGEDSFTLYGGAVTALNRDINSNGVLLRFSAAYGEYEYNNAAVAGGKVNIDATSMDIMLGYQWVNPTAITAVYLGADYRDNSLSPADPANSTSGDETGAKVQFEVFSTSASMPGSSLIASYSSVNDTYFMRGRLGFSVGSMHMGPELSALGDEEYDAVKAGVFLGGISIGNNANMTLNAGYSDTSGTGSGDGAYGGVSLSFRF